MQFHSFIYNFFLLFFSLPLLIFAQKDEIPLQISQYNYKLWTNESGIPSNGALFITQTSDKYIWLGTYNGAVKFDGIKMNVFNNLNTKAAKSNIYYSMKEDKDGNLFFATAGGLLIKFKNNKWKLISTKEGLLTNIVEVVYIDSNNMLWAGSAGGACYINMKDTNNITINYLLKNKNVTSITEDAHHNIWISTLNAGIYKYNHKNIDSFRFNINLKNTNLNCIYGDKYGNVWIGSSKGIFKIYNDKLVETYALKTGLPYEDISAIYQDSKGIIWFGSIGGIFNLINGNFSKCFKIKEAKSYDVSGISEDNEGNIWVSTFRTGIFRMQTGKFISLTEDEGLAGNSVFGIIQRKNKDILIATENKINVIKHGEISTWQLPEYLKIAYIKDIYEDSKQNIWIASRSGLVCYNEKEYKKYTTKDGLTNNYARFLVEDLNRNLWIGTMSGLTQMKDGKFIGYTTANGLSNNFILSLFVDSKNNLWVGTREGLNVIKDGKITNYSTKDGLVGYVVFQIYEDSQGNIWIGQNGGITLYRNGKFTPFTTQDGLAVDVAFQIIEDDFGIFWIPCNDGIYTIKKSDLIDFADGKIKKFHSQLYTNLDGMKEKNCQANTRNLKASDGKIWFATLNGVSIINPKKLKINTQKPNVIIENLFIDDKEVPIGEEIILEAGSHRVEMKYTAISLSTPERVLFKYKLDGFDKDFIDAQKRREIFYPNFPLGKYKFKVIACNNDGIWNETGASITIEQRPYFYQTYWFIIICVVSFIVLFFILYNIRIYQVQKRNEHLAILVKEKTFELAEKNTELEQQKEEMFVQNEMLQSQKNEIEKSYYNLELLSKIGKEITSNLTVAKIFDTVYQHINELMDANVFAIGVYNSKRNSIDFHSGKENGQDLPFWYFSLDDDKRLATICFLKQIEIVISDYSIDYKKYIPQIPNTIVGSSTKSILYLPLINQEEKIGVITVQSFKKNAFSEYQLNILRNIAVYSAIAIENANAYNKINLQRIEIENKNTQITDSINYAKQIQNAVLSSETILKYNFSDFFILYLPCDIVSGDFYWFKKVSTNPNQRQSADDIELKENELLIVAVVDCTGHGVPGAFMSMLGVALLNEIINRTDITQANKILDELRSQIISSLHQTGKDNETKDGMDMSLCIFNKSTLKMQYAGANNPIFIIRKYNEKTSPKTEFKMTLPDSTMELIELKPDKMPIGIHAYDKIPFSSQEIQLYKNDCIYMFTDGFEDQIGGMKRKKFYARNMKNLLLSICNQPMDEQRVVLNHTINVWRGAEFEQVDDILVLGIKI